MYSAVATFVEKFSQLTPFSLESETLDETDKKVRIFFKDFSGWKEVEQLENKMLVDKSFRPFVLESSSDELSDKVARFHAYYTEQNKPIEGPYGDFVVLKPMGDESFVVTAVGQQYFDLIKEAADMLPVAKIAMEDGSFRYKVAMIDRMFAPYGLAFTGGFCDVKGPSAESAIHAAFREFDEETGRQAAKTSLSLKPKSGDLDGLQEEYDLAEVATTASIHGMQFDAVTTKLGTIPTSRAPFGKGGEVLKDNSSRVHKTTGYTCVFEVPEKDAKDLDNWLHVTEETKGVQWVDITDMVEKNDVPSSVSAKRKIDDIVQTVSLAKEHVAFGHHFQLLGRLVHQLQNQK